MRYTCIHIYIYIYILPNKRNEHINTYTYIETVPLLSIVKMFKKKNKNKMFTLYNVSTN